MQQVQFISITPEQLQNAIIEGVKTQLQDLKQHFQPKEPKQYLTRQEVAKMLSVDLSTIHNWKIKGILKAYQIGGRVFYMRRDIEDAIIQLEN